MERSGVILLRYKNRELEMKRKQIMAAIGALVVLVLTCLVLWHGIESAAWMVFYKSYDSIWTIFILLPFAFVGVTSFFKLVKIARKGSD